MPHSVLVVDNASIHKAWLRANCARVNANIDSDNGSIYDVFWEAVYSVTSDKAKGRYSHCGYRYQDAP